jgi:2-polyprenyl-3-methyl-5-hydroxy-6-metoxy-1,4-benzoquinol methylase
MTYTNQVSDQVRKLYDTMAYATYKEDYSFLFKPLGLDSKSLRQELQGKRMAEIGCGGGQISLFMSQYFMDVTGFDISPKSLELARKTALDRGVKNVEFLERDLFDGEFLKEFGSRFDYVLCYGVLHHTGNPRQGFNNLTELAKPGGFVTIGVYSRTLFKYRCSRQLVLWLAGNSWEARKRIANKLIFRGKGNDISLYDGFVHPQVSFHSISQVWQWYQLLNFMYVGSWPYIELETYWSWFKQKITGRPWVPPIKLSRWNYRFLAFLLVEIVWTVSRKQAMVTMIGKKPMTPKN